MNQCTERLFPHASGGTFPASLLGKKALEGFRKVDLPSILNQMTGGKGMRVIIPLYLRAQINKKLSNTTFMSLSKFESEVKFIPQPNVYVYSRFADLSNLGAIKERLADPEVQERIGQQVPADKVEELKKYVEAMTFDTDSIQIASPLGNISLRIVERDEPKCVKLASEGAPVQLYVWIQLLPHGEAETKMRVTVGAEVNFFMKGMVAKPLQQAADGLAQMLSMMR